MNRAGVLIRVSTARQLEGTSPEKQLERILYLASEQGYSVDEKHIWKLAESGASRDRAGFQEALRAGANHQISRIYVFNIDRLGRDLLEMLLFLRQLDELDIECWGAERAELLRGDDFLFQIQGAVASKERQEIIRRTQDGVRRAINAGKYSGGIIAYGYRVSSATKKLEIHEEEAKVVRRIFDWCIHERISCRQIADRLNALGVSTHYARDGRVVHSKGKRDAEKTAGIWRAGRIRNILRNPAYMGQWQWGKRSKKTTHRERISGYCPPLVPESVFRQAGQILQGNQLFAPENQRRNYLLRGVINCGGCGRAYCGSYSRVGSTRSREKTYYRCNGHTQWKKLGIPKCESQSLDAEDIEAVVWNDIKAFCKNPEIALGQLRAQRKPLDDSIDDRIREVARQITELKRQELNLLRIAAESHEVDLAALDTVLGDNRRSQEALRLFRNQLEVEKARANTLEDELIEVAERLAKLGERIDQATFDERRRAVVELVKEIQVVPDVVDGKRVSLVTITYRFNDPDTMTAPTPLDPAVIQDCMPARAATTATRSKPAPAPPPWLPSTRSASPARCWIASTSTSRCRGWSTTSSARTGWASLPPACRHAWRPPASGSGGVSKGRTASPATLTCARRRCASTAGWTTQGIH